MEKIQKFNYQQKPKIITDLDQSDEPQRDDEIKPDQFSKLTKIQKHRHRDKNLKNLSANFPSAESLQQRSRSASNTKDEIRYLKLLIQTKDNQTEKLVQRITELHNCNEEFSEDHQRLQNDLINANKKLESITKSLNELQNERCQICGRFEEEKDNFIKENKSLKDDVTMMKTLVHRLNVQVEKYQDKIRKTQIDESKPEEVIISQRFHNESPYQEVLEWGSVNTHTLGPLLSAYEEMLKEKEFLIQQYETELNRFTGHLKEVLEENERQHKEMDEMRKGKDGWREEKTRLQAQIDVFRSKAEVQTRRGDLAKEKLVEVLRCYEQKVQSQTLDLERMQEAYTRAKNELVSYKNLNSQPEAIINSLKECQRLFEELKNEHTNDKIRLSNEMEELRKEKSEIETKNSELKEENFHLKNDNQKHINNLEEMQEKYSSMKGVTQKLKESRDRLKARLRIALQWAHKLEESRTKMKNTWDELRELEAIVRNKEAQIRGLHARHLEEMSKMEKKLSQRDETIKSILKEKAKAT